MQINHGKKNLLGININAVNYAAAVDLVIRQAETKQPLTVSALAVHGVMTGVLDPAIGHRLNQLDLVVPDGQPVRWALNALHKTGLPDRVYGPTLMLKICEQAAQRGLSIYLYGSRADLLERLETNLRQKFPALKIAGKSPSLFRPATAQEKAAVIKTIQDSGASIVFVGLGCPRQEVWAYEYRAALSMPLIAVGAAFDFHAGTVSQAPAYLQNAGLEWFYRLVQEPRRLWRRYLYLNPLYILLFLLQFTGLKRFSPVQLSAAPGDVGYA